jgi:chromatin modification-related protein VID21
LRNSNHAVTSKKPNGVSINGLRVDGDAIHHESHRKPSEERVVDIPSRSLEAASSPSSTAGAYSTSTPKHAPPSPDTSPEAAPSPGPHPDLVDQPASFPSITDSISSAQDKSFLQTAASDSTPEAQLRLEEAQANEAASRSAKSSISTEAQGETQSNEVAEEGTTSSETPPEKPKASEEESLDLTSMDSAQLPHSASNGDVEMLDATPKKTEVSHSSNNIIKSSSQQVASDSTPGRMTTRVASGAIRQKSVSEILGETPKAPQQLLSPPDIRESKYHPKSTDHRDQSRMSTVVFSRDKDLTSQAARSELDGYLALKGASLDSDKDYLRPLFLYQAWLPPRGHALSDLINHTRKAITTSDMASNLREQIDYRILRRIYQLQNANKWSLRQPIKYPEPAPVTCHFDLMMDEMKWMRTDFREERKWKLAAARNLAQWCANYVNASDEDKVVLRIKHKSPSQRVIADSFDEPPELISGGTSEASEDEIPLAIAVQTPPHALFSLGFDDVIFKVDDTPSAHALIEELPSYDPKAEGQPSDPAIPVPPTSNILPVSKFVDGKIVPRMSGICRKRSRYDYEQSDDEYVPRTHKRARSDSQPSFLSPARRSSPRTELPPEDQEVALFNPVNRHILTRIRANNSFRPPSEFLMPSQAFYENRFQSKWTWDEDQRLRHCVRQYNYNWSLISMDLQNKCQSSTYVSGMDRRTPWECFERWTQLEGLPPDLSRGLYFKAYSQRIEAAVKAVQERPSSAVQNGGVRIRGLPPDKIQHRRDTRHISMIEAMRRLARRRENNIHRQQEGITSQSHPIIVKADDSSYENSSNAQSSC